MHFISPAPCLDSRQQHSSFPPPHLLACHLKSQSSVSLLSLRKQLAPPKDINEVSPLSWLMALFLLWLSLCLCLCLFLLLLAPSPTAAAALAAFALRTLNANAMELKDFSAHNCARRLPHPFPSLCLCLFSCLSSFALPFASLSLF